MNDDRLAELGRLFDGELDEPAADALRASLDDDPDAQRYLDLLGRLRTLAQAHDPAAAATPAARRRGSWTRRALRPALAIAATLLVLLGVPSDPPSPQAPELAPAPAARVALPAPRRVSLASRVRPDDPLEVGLHVWANGPSRHPEQAARLILAQATGPRNRAATREVLALELANATPGAIGRVREVASQRPTSQRRIIAPRRSVPVAPPT